jgi:hypothetical protein
MNDDEENFRHAIREYIHFKLDEISTTSNVAGYLTPYAFSKNGKSSADRVKKMAKMIGYTLTKRGENDIKHVDKLDENYSKFKKDETETPPKKISRLIKTIVNHVEEIERNANMTTRYQQEKAMSGDMLWKITKKQIVKLEKRLQKVIEKLRDLRG